MGVSYLKRAKSESNRKAAKGLFALGLTNTEVAKALDMKRKQSTISRWRALWKKGELK